MAKSTADKPRRVVAVPLRMWNELTALSLVRRTTCAELTREIIGDYLVENTDEVKAALEFEKQFQASLKEFAAKTAE